MDDGIFCNDCGAELDEAPTLLPDQRPPCPRCGSLARWFEQDITEQIAFATLCASRSWRAAGRPG